MEINVFLDRLFGKKEKQDVARFGDDGELVVRQGRKIQRAFLDSYNNEQERYIVDFAENRLKEGWLQFDTRQDAPYFGVWMNPLKLQTLSYAEGDWSLVTCDDKDSYNQEIESAIEFYDEGRIALAIDRDGNSTEYRQDRTKFFVD